MKRRGERNGGERREKWRGEKREMEGKGEKNGEGRGRERKHCGYEVGRKQVAESNQE